MRNWLFARTGNSLNMHFLLSRSSNANARVHLLAARLTNRRMVNRRIENGERRIGMTGCGQLVGDPGVWRRGAAASNSGLCELCRVCADSKIFT